MIHQKQKKQFTQKSVVSQAAVAGLKSRNYLPEELVNEGWAEVTQYSEPTIEFIIVPESPEVEWVEEWETIVETVYAVNAEQIIQYALMISSVSKRKARTGRNPQTGAPL